MTQTEPVRTNSDVLREAYDAHNRIAPSCRARAAIGDILDWEADREAAQSPVQPVLSGLDVKTLTAALWGAEPCESCAKAADGMGCWRHRVDGAGYVPSPTAPVAEPPALRCRNCGRNSDGCECEGGGDFEYLGRAVPVAEEGLREAAQALFDNDGAFRGFHTLDALRAALASSSSDTDTPIRKWMLGVVLAWREHWEGKDHRYGRDLAAFLGERLTTDFNLGGDVPYPFGPSRADTPSREGSDG